MARSAFAQAACALLVAHATASFTKIGDGYCRSINDRVYDEYYNDANVPLDTCKLQCALFDECVAIEYMTTSCALLGMELKTTGSLGGAVKSGSIANYKYRKGNGLYRKGNLPVKVAEAEGVQCLTKTGNTQGLFSLG